jgi:hypothetical protein
MDTVELIVVQESFQLSRVGVVLVPDFPAPRGWKSFADPVTIVRPDGARFDVECHFTLVHFRITDPAARMDSNWRVALTFPGAVKEDFPKGSRVLVRRSAADAVAGTAA